MLLQDIPEFEMYSPRFRSKENSTTPIHILYMTNQTNFGCGIQSPFGSFFVDFVGSCLFLALLACIRLGVCLRHAQCNAPSIH